jgi:hypothetical protein
MEYECFGIDTFYVDNIQFRPAMERLIEFKIP